MFSILPQHPLLVTAVIFVGFSLPIVLYDIRAPHIPDIVPYMGIITLCCYRFACTRKELPVYLLSACMAVLIFLLVKNVSKKGIKQQVIPYSAFCALYAGPVAIFIGFLLSALYAALFCAFKKLKGTFSRTAPLPLTPFMALGTASTAALPLLNFLLQNVLKFA